MLTGKRAFEEASAASVIAAILERDAPSVSDVAPASPDRVLKKCLAKDPDERWQTARDLKDELAWIASGGGVAVPQPARKPVLLWVALAISLVAAAALAFIHFREAPPPAAAGRHQIYVTIPPGLGGDVSLEVSVGARRRRSW